MGTNSNSLQFPPDWLSATAVPRRVLIILLLATSLITGCESFSWGDDIHGQLADGVIGGSRVSPGVAASGYKWLDVKAGRFHACGIRNNATLWCWGLNSQGQLGDGTTTSSGSPVQVGTHADWQQIAPAYRHTCGIRAGQMWCWGLGSNGELGDGLSTSSLTPVRVGTASDWKEVATGWGRFSCGVRGQGDLSCWGRNTQGELGVGDYTNRAVPTAVPNSPWKGVTAGFSHACAISSFDLLYCWGRNDEFQASPNNQTNYSSPTLTDGTTVKMVSAGSTGTCMMFSGGNRGPEWNGRVFCRGVNAPRGYSGPGPFVGCEGDPCENIVRFRHMSLGRSHACGVVQGTNQGLCWGTGSDGQLGNGLALDSDSPVAVQGAKEWFRVLAGDDYSIGLENPPP